EAVPVDDEALMRARADLVDAVMRHNFEFGARTSHLDAFRIDGDGHAGRCGRFMGDVDLNAETALAGFEMRLQQLYAGPFHQTDHEAGGEYVRHGAELRRFGVKLRHGLRLGDGIGKTVLQPGLERWLHGSPFRSRASPAFSSPGMALSMPS